MGVYVLGMHRSGTSAVTRVINLLGVPIGRAERLMPVQDDNPAGFWEHLPLMDVNDAVLERLGGTWDAPTEPDPSFAAAPEFADLVTRARDEFRATYDGGRWVFKDPRVSVVLPLWRHAVDTGASPGDVAVIVVRNPLDIAASLARRNHIAVSYTLALWERYTRLILRDAAGLPAYVIDYDALVDDPRGAGALETFLIERHQIDGAPDHEAVRASLTTSLRHGRNNRAALEDDDRVTPEQRALYDALIAALGTHDAYAPASPPPPSSATDALIEAHRDPSTPARAALDAATRAVGELEWQLAEARADAEQKRAAYDALEATLGYTDLGRLERAALGAARRARGVQQRFNRP
jgi:hypothetical protein